MKKHLLVIIIFIFYSCDNEKALMVPENTDIINIVNTKSQSKISIEKFFRVILIGEVSNKMHIYLYYKPKRSKEFKKKPIIYSPEPLARASYFTLPENTSIKDLKFKIWANSNFKEGTIELNQIIFKNNFSTFVVPANELEAYFSLNKYLTFNNETNILRGKNLSSSKYKPEIFANSKLIEELMWLGKDIDQDEKNKFMEKNIEESNKTKSHNKNTLLVSFNINIKKADEIQLFYLDLNNKQYNANKSIVKNVKPTENNSAINFEINTSFGFPTNLRFDYGSVKDQQVVINNITFKKGNREFTIDQSEVHKYFNSPKEWNINVDLKNAVYGTKKHENRYDPKLYGNEKITNLLENFEKN